MAILLHIYILEENYMNLERCSFLDVIICLSEVYVILTVPKFSTNKKRRYEGVYKHSCE